MIKIVPDANILISGMFGFPSHPRKIISLALAKEIVLYGNKETYEEFCEKVRLKKFKKYWDSQIFTPDKMISDYFTLVTMAEPFDTLAGVNIVKPDPDDDKYFRVAKVCGAKVIVTGDKKVLEIKKYDDIRVITVANFLESYTRLKGR